MTDRSKKSFNEQAYLIYHWFYKNRGSLNKKDSGFGSRIRGKALSGAASVHKITGNYNIANMVPKIMSKSNLDFYSNFLNLETHKISALVPYVKLYKVAGNANIPFYFPVSSEQTDINTMLQHGASIGGVGIKDFSMSFQGQDPFMRDKAIVCELSIYLDSIELLYRPPPAGYATLADLISISRNKSVSLSEGISKEVTSHQVNRALDHEIAVDVGYSVADDSAIFDHNERAAITNTNLFLRMKMNNHTIDISADGTATLNVSFIGRASSVLENSAYNALFQSPDFLALSSVLVDEKKKLEKSVNTTDKKKVQKITAELKKDTVSKLRGIFDYLDGDMKTLEDLKESRIKELKITSSDMKSYFEFVNKSRDPSPSTQGRENTPPDNITKEPDNPDSLQGADSATSSLDFYDGANGIAVSYVHMGDLVESFIYNTKNNLKSAIKQIDSLSISDGKKRSRKKTYQLALKELSTFKILFGSIAIPLGEKKSVAVNLADVPISLTLLQRYFFEEIQQKFTTKYTINTFLEDLVGRVYPMLLNDHLYRDAPGLDLSASPKTMMLCGEKTSSLRPGNVNVSIRDLPDFLKRRNSLRRKKDDIDCLVIYGEVSDKHSVGGDGNVGVDIRDGIYHLNLGKNKGFVKNISFSQMTQKYRKEALMVESVSLYDELKMPYNASIEMIGNNLFLPGSIVYINPSSVGFGDPRNSRSASARLGIGGYYQIISVKTQYSSGVLKTTLEASFNSFPDSDKRTNPFNTTDAVDEFLDYARRKVQEKRR